MSLNTAHANGGVLIHAGESIILFCDNVEIEFSGQDSKEFKGIILTKKESEGTVNYTSPQSLIITISFSWTLF